MIRPMRTGAVLASLAMGIGMVHAPAVFAQEEPAPMACPAKAGDPVPTPTLVVDPLWEGATEVHVYATGWCAQPGYGGSSVVVKFDRGGYSREDESHLADEFKGRGVWQVIEADETGMFNEYIELPKDLEVGDHSIAFLSGSFKKNDKGELVDEHRSEFSYFTIGEHIPDDLVDPAFVVALSSSIGEILSANYKDNIIVIPDNEKKELKVIYPAGTPGKWYSIGTLNPSLVYGTTGPECNDFSGLSPLGYDEEKKEYVSYKWHKLGEDRSITVPYSSIAEDGPGPFVVIMQREDPNAQGINSTYNHDSIVGYAWVNNHGNKDNKEYYPGAIDPFNPGRNRIEGKNVSDNDIHSFDFFLCNGIPAMGTDGNPSGFNRGIAYPVSPVVDASRSIVIPQTPAVEYFIDGEKVTGTVEPTGDESRTVTVVAKPSEGFRFIFTDDDGTVLVDHPMEMPYEVTVPAVDVAEPAPAPSIGVLRALLADRGVSVADSAAPTDDEVAALQNAVVGVVDPAYTVTVADGAVVVARDGAEPARYALSDLFPKPEPQPEPSEQPAPTSDPAPTSEPVTPPAAEPKSGNWINVGSAAGVGLLGALFGVLVSVLSLGGFLASNPVLVQALPQPLRDMLNHARS